MPSTYSTNLAIELIGNNDQAGTWGNTTNTNLGTLIEQAISGYVTQAVSTGTDTTITIPNGATGVARNMYIELTGTGGASTNLIVPANKKLYFIFNNTSSGQVTVKVSGQTGVSVPNGKKMVLVSNGTDIVTAENYVASLSTDNLSLTGNLTLSGGTANGVLYLNGSKVATSGSALTFDGTNFGVGTASYGNAGSINAAVGVPGTTTGGLQLWSSTTANHFVQFGDGTAGDGPYRGAVGYNHTLDSLLFYAAGAEKAVLNSTGLGIGTASPAAKLHVSGQSRVADSSNAANYMTFGVGANAPFGNASISTTTAGLSIVAEGAGNMTFLNNGSEAMRIDTANNLGLGVTPSAWASGNRFIDVNASASYGAFGNTDAMMLANAFWNGSNWIRKNDGNAFRFVIESVSTAPTINWQVAANSTAGSTISFTQAMTLDADGDLGIGTTNPTQRLHIVSSGQPTILIADDAGRQVSIKSPDSSGNPGFVGTTTNHNLLLQAGTSGAGANVMLFNTAGSERARITAAGYFKASDSGTYRNAAGVYHELRNSDGSNPTVFVTNSNASTPYGIAVEFTAAAPDNNTQFFFRAEDNVAIRCYIWADGDLANHDGVYGTISDERLKQDIVDAGSQWDDLKSIRFRKYRMKTDVEANPDAPAMFGVVAQELAQVCPGLVDEHPNMKTVEVTDEEGNVTQTQEPDGTTTLTVKSSILLMKAAKALQEAMARIEQLEADMAALKASA